MYCYLFELNEIGLSLRVLDKAMCPRFHVDHVPCRLITTYTGVTTQWLPHTSVDRSKLEKVIMVKKMKNLVCLVKEKISSNFVLEMLHFLKVKVGMVIQEQDLYIDHLMLKTQTVKDCY